MVLIVGEPYWRKTPDPEHIRQLEAGGMELDGECTRLTRDLYLHFGRDSVGWAIYVFVKP